VKAEGSRGAENGPHANSPDDPNTSYRRCPIRILFHRLVKVYEQGPHAPTGGRAVEATTLPHAIENGLCQWTPEEARADHAVPLRLRTAQEDRQLERLPTGDMTATRFGHNPIVLRTGRVLATGGCCQAPDDVVLASVEVYSRRTGTWQAEESMSVARLGHTTTRLRSGEVLVTGGANEIDGVMAGAELFTPAR
jgi:hypothetical protein